MPSCSEPTYLKQNNQHSTQNFFCCHALHNELQLFHKNKFHWIFCITMRLACICMRAITTTRIILWTIIINNSHITWHDDLNKSQWSNINGLSNLTSRPIYWFQQELLFIFTQFWFFFLWMISNLFSHLFVWLKFEIFSLCYCFFFISKI